MAVIEINPVTDVRWMEFINKFAVANIFHHPSWLKLISGQYKFNVFALCSVNSAQNIEAALPFCVISGIKKKWISLPFTDYIAPLYDSKEGYGEIMDYLVMKQKAKEVDSIEIRYAADAFLNSSGGVYHILDLENKNEEVIFNSLKDSHKRNIKKSLKMGLSVEILHTAKSLDEFYSLHLKTRRKQGIPIQQRSFFNRIFDTLIQNDLGFVILVKKDDKAISAGIFLEFNKTLTYKYGASDPRELLLRPNNLMFKIAIEYSLKKRYNYFDFGKTDNENIGLREFKSGWGAVEYPLFYSYLPVLPKKRLFSFVKDNIMKPVIKISPAFICRVTGELLYKYSV